jgi:hypothetical protein
MNESIWRHSEDWIKLSVVDRRVSNVLVVQSDHQALTLFWDVDVGKLYQNVWPELRPLLVVGYRKLLPSNPENAESYDSVYTYADRDRLIPLRFRAVVALCLGVVALIFLYKSLERDEPRIWLYWSSSLVGGAALILFLSAFVR